MHKQVGELEALVPQLERVDEDLKMGVGLVMFNRNMVVNWVNEPLAAMFGFRSEGMVGRKS